MTKMELKLHMVLDAMKDVWNRSSSCIQDTQL